LECCRKQNKTASFIGQVQIRERTVPVFIKLMMVPYLDSNRNCLEWLGTRAERPHLITLYFDERITRGTPSGLYLMRIELWCKGGPL
jgi:hypothetical protein